MISSLNQLFTRLTDRSSLGLLILRITVGGLMLFHGVAKLNYGIAGIEGMLLKKGLPAFFASGVYVGEVIAPLLIILGIFTRISALILAITIIVAIFLTNSYGNFFVLSSVGASSLEAELFYLLGSLTIMFMGSGRYSIVDSNYR